MKRQDLQPTLQDRLRCSTKRGNDSRKIDCNQCDGRRCKPCSLQSLALGNSARLRSRKVWCWQLPSEYPPHSLPARIVGQLARTLCTCPEIIGAVHHELRMSLKGIKTDPVIFSSENLDCWLHEIILSWNSGVASAVIIAGLLKRAKTSSAYGRSSKIRNRLNLLWCEVSKVAQ